MSLGFLSVFVEKFGDVAQLGEHLPCTQRVAGSIPVISTIFFVEPFVESLLATTLFKTLLQ